MYKKGRASEKKDGFNVNIIKVNLGCDSSKKSIITSINFAVN